MAADLLEVIEEGLLHSGWGVLEDFSEVLVPELGLEGRGGVC